MYGGNLQVSYKQFDLSVAIAGQTGNDILNRRRGEVLFTNDTNMDADFAINRWHGEGTSNSYPSSEGRRKAWNQRMSTFFVEDGSFFRIPIGRPPPWSDRSQPRRREVICDQVCNAPIWG